VIEVNVHKLMIDDNTNSPVVILKEAEGNRMLPIWIGSAEANAIAMVLQGQAFPRPLTHDLLSAIIRGLRANVVKIIISDLKDNTFYATVLLHGTDEQLTFDARPSDSIALALRSGCPIFVAESLLEGAGDRVDASQLRPPSEEERAEELRRYLAKLSPEDFGKFQL
jgi:bifunctional DNase/RNase